jgi:hypothetical protein
VLIVEYLAAFVSANAGTSQPVSDRWGISLVPAIILFFGHHRTDVLRSLLLSTIKWVADRYDRGTLGLAGPYGTPQEETAYLLGAPFEHIKLDRRSASYLVTIILDVCSVLEQQELFDLARNEFLAVEVCPPMLEVADDQNQYSVDGPNYRYEPNVPYEETWRPTDGWKTAPHHRRNPVCNYSERMGRPWDQLAISCVVRDRHFVQNWRRFVEASVPN